MQTFVPLANFRHTARALDYKRLGKQRVENLQIIQALSGNKLFTSDASVDPLTGRKVIKEWAKNSWYCAVHPVGWAHHPVLAMWRGHERLLLEYHLDICTEWKDRGYKDTCLEKFLFIWEHCYDDEDEEDPDWLGYAPFHLAHQSVLIAKNREHYLPLFPGAPEGLEIIWPTR